MDSISDEDSIFDEFDYGGYDSLEERPHVHTFPGMSMTIMMTVAVVVVVVWGGAHYFGEKTPPVRTPVVKPAPTPSPPIVTD